MMAVDKDRLGESIMAYSLSKMNWIEFQDL